MGAREFVSKPIDLDEFTATVRSMVGVDPAQLLESYQLAKRRANVAKVDLSKPFSDLAVSDARLSSEYAYPDPEAEEPASRSPPKLRPVREKKLFLLDEPFEGVDAVGAGLFHFPGPPRVRISAGTQGAPRPVTLSYPVTERSELSTFSTILPLLLG